MKSSYDAWHTMGFMHPIWLTDVLQLYLETFEFIHQYLCTWMAVHCHLCTLSNFQVIMEKQFNFGRGLVHQGGEVFSFFFYTLPIGATVEWVQAGTFQVVECLLKGTQFQQARLCGRCGLNVQLSISKDAPGASAQGTPRSWWSPHPWWPWDSAQTSASPPVNHSSRIPGTCWIRWWSFVVSVFQLFSSLVILSNKEGEWACVYNNTLFSFLFLYSL